jgi:3'(2'), 5'-bisphosphate nucleotidase
VENLNKQLKELCGIANRAGDAILEIYQQAFAVEEKADGSPLTLADQTANAIILEGLSRLDTGIPQLSEETFDPEDERRLAWGQYWLIDPLDGTREFINRNGEFTVNIALIDNGKPVIGVVYTPVRSLFHVAAVGQGAWRQQAGSDFESIATRSCQKQKITMVSSRSHESEKVVKFRDNLINSGATVDITRLGSSLKIVQVAEGSADIYPRLGLTSEWDTAAAQCVLECAGGEMLDLQGKPLRYNKPDILNPHFLAIGDKDFAWPSYI